jgi:hypothetical protein
MAPAKSSDFAETLRSAERVGALSTVGKMFEQKPVSILHWISTGFLMEIRILLEILLSLKLGTVVARVVNELSDLSTKLACHYSTALHSGREQRFSGFVIMFHSYDNITLFLSCFDIPVSLSNLFQRIAAINHRFYLSRLYKFFEEK